MANFDLDVIVEKKRYIKFNGKDVEIKPLTVDEYLMAEAELDSIAEIGEDPNIKSYKDVMKASADHMVNYLMMVLDLTEEEARAMDYRQFRELKAYFTRLDLKDQGLTDQEIARMEKQQLKNQMKQMMDVSSQ